MAPYVLSHREQLRLVYGRQDHYLVDDSVVPQFER
jgi:hypothetical protein